MGNKDRLGPMQFKTSTRTSCGGKTRNCEGMTSALGLQLGGVVRTNGKPMYMKFGADRIGGSSGNRRKATVMWQ